jgi:hypothetical protein
MIGWLVSRVASLEQLLEDLSARVLRLEREIVRLRQENQRLGGQR